MTDKDTIKELEEQARNTKMLMDRLNLAYIGLTTDEILRLALPHLQSEFDKAEALRNDA